MGCDTCGGGVRRIDTAAAPGYKGRMIRPDPAGPPGRRRAAAAAP